MGRLIAIGDPARIVGFALAGAVVLPAESPQAVRDAWAHRPDETEIAILTTAAAEALGGAADEPDGPLTVVLPDLVGLFDARSVGR